MKPQKLSLEAIKNAHAELTDIFEKKNKDYGNSFEESLEKHGIIAAIVRMEDKMLRLSNLSKNQSEQLVKDESIIDTLKDLSNYALMTAVWLEQTKRLQEIDDKISEYKEVPFSKTVEDDSDISYKVHGWELNKIIKDIKEFDPDLIISESIQFDGIENPRTMVFYTIDVDNLINWFNTYINRSKYLLKTQNNKSDSGLSKAVISIYEDGKKNPNGYIYEQRNGVL